MRKLGVRGLPAAEAGLVRAFMQLLAGDEDGFGWCFATDAPFDALLVDTADASLMSRLYPGVPVCVVGPAPLPDAAWHMTRPLQRAVLAAWLAQLGESARAPLTAAQAAAAEREQPLDVMSEPPALAAPAPPRYRLNRWPPAALLRNHPARVRMATLLGKRALTLDELARASGQPAPQCQVFLQLLQGFSLVETTMQPPAAPSARRAPDTPRNATAPASPLARVVRSLRLRLGLPQ